MINDLPNILEHVTSVPWAMDHTTLDNMKNVLTRRMSGVHLSDEKIEDVTAARRGKPRTAEESEFRIADGAAIIPIHGVIAKHSRQVNGSSQPRGTSVEALTVSLNKALGDDRAKRIFLHIESPGGSVAGTADLADAVFAANQVKPVIAFADDMCASGAYWIGSQASRFYGNQTARVGSIGVYALMLDSSRAEKSAGFDFILVRSGANKGVGAPGIQITDANITQYQTEIDHYFNLFTSAVMRGRGPRGMSAEGLAEIADGRCLIGSDAVDANLIDRIKTFGQALTSALPNTATIHASSVTTEKQTASSRSNDLEPAATKPQETIEVQEDKTMAKDDNQPDAAAIAKAERTRCKDVSTILAGHPKLIEQAMDDENCGKAEAAEMLVPVLQSQIADETTRADEAEGKLKAIADAGGTKVQVESSDEEEPPKTKEEKEAAAKGEYETRVAALVAGVDGADGQGESMARIAASKEFPEAHTAWLKKKDDARKGKK